MHCLERIEGRKNCKMDREIKPSKAERSGGFRVGGKVLSVLDESSMPSAVKSIHTR